MQSRRFLPRFVTTLSARLRPLRWAGVLCLAFPWAEAPAQTVKLTVIRSFAGFDGGSGELIPGADGNFYGVVDGGGGNRKGAVFRLTPDGTPTVLYSFTGGGDGMNATGLLQGTDGNFYGTALGGASGSGVAFRLTPGGVLTVLHTFAADGSEGKNPGPLAQGSDGAFYGTAVIGGDADNGTVFRLAPDGTLGVLHRFEQSFTTDDGQTPLGRLVPGSEGTFYGVTTSGGKEGYGLVFSVTPAGEFAVVHDFAGGDADGQEPSAGMIRGHDGNLYGTTLYGGTREDGTVYRLTPGGVFAVVHSFDAQYFGEGTAPSRLSQDAAGNFYGTLNVGRGYGSVFKLTPAGVPSTLYDFTDRLDGISAAVGNVVVNGAGNVFGLAPSGQFGGAGILFELGTLPVATVLAEGELGTTAVPEQGEYFVVSLSFAPAADVHVSYTVKGSAAAGVDYVALKGTAKIKAGNTSKVIKVVPLDPAGTAQKIVRLKLLPGDGYDVGDEFKDQINLPAAGP